MSLRGVTHMHAVTHIILYSAVLACMYAWFCATVYAAVHWSVVGNPREDKKRER